MNSTASEVRPVISEESDQQVIMQLITLAKTQQVGKVSRLRMLMSQQAPEVSEEQITRCLGIIGRRIRFAELES